MGLIQLDGSWCELNGSLMVAIEKLFEMIRFSGIDWLDGNGDRIMEYIQISSRIYCE